MRRRVVVTGIGTVSAAGPDTRDFTDALLRGRRCFTELTDPRIRHLRADRAALIPELRPCSDDPSEVKQLDRNVHLALAAGRQAVRHAGLGTDPLGDRAGIVLGTCSGGMLSIEHHYAGLVHHRDSLDESLHFSKQYYTTAKVLAWATGAGGPALTVITACAAGSGAIAQGADLIRSGLADLVLAGGSDTFALSTLAGFDALKATCTGECAPFSTTIGLNLGEGAAFLVLEELANATAREAPLLAELLGSGLSNDAYHATSPDPSTKGQLAAMQRALDDAGAPSEAIDYINAHGTGTRANDPIESRAIAKLLGDRVDAVPVSSTKSMIGHCLGGAGALEASATLLGAQANVLPPTAGFDTPREGCNLPDFVSEPGRPFEGRLALSNSFGFGGNNACLLLDVRPDVETPRTPLTHPSSSAAVISGFGLVSPQGLDLESLRDGETSAVVNHTDRFGLPVEPFPLGLVPDLDHKTVDRRLNLRGMDRCSQYTTMAARLALAHADIPLRPARMAEVGMVLGLSSGPTQAEADHLTAVFSSDFDISHLGAFPYVVPNEVAGHAARTLMLKGHNTVITAGHGSGLLALLSAAIAVEQGHADTVIAAAADELTERTVADGYRLGRWGPGTDVIPGEGASALVLENRLTTQSRSGRPRAEIVGYGLTCEASDPCRGSAAALSRAVETALDRAGIRPRSIATIATGSATPVDEHQAIARLFGDHHPQLISLAPTLGFAEATLSLYNLIHALETSPAESHLLCTTLSPEGFACAAVLKTFP